MTPDIVKELGYLALGTRLRRLGERLQSQTQALLEEADIGLPASHFPFLAALDRLECASVGEITDAIGISQPGVTRVLDKLEDEGLVQSRQPAGDRRVRTVVLSRSGQQLVARAKQAVWPIVETAVADACADPAGSLLGRLTALEEALAAAPLKTRAKRLLARSKGNAVA
jgi:DNA-binding MarR family transcriptional regulator